MTRSSLEDSLGRNEQTQESYCLVEVESCHPHHAVVGMRFEYDSEALERNMSENGQLEPCRAVRDEQNLTQLLVYVGQRRLTAAKNLKSKFGTPSTLKLIIDEDGLSQEELVKRALAENVDERGERLSLSDLEKISYARDLMRNYDGQKTERILVKAGFDRNSAKKILSLVGKLESEQIVNLHKIECKSNFRFKIAHLDLLLGSQDLRNFYETAAVAAFSQKPPEEIKTMIVCSGYFSKDIPWFYDIFPEFVVRRVEDEVEDGATIPVHDLPQGEGKKRISERVSGISETALEPVIVVNCHYCNSANLFKLKTGTPEFVFCNLKEGGLIEKLSSAANTVFDCERECSKCQRSFWISVSRLDGHVVVETSSSKLVTVSGKEALMRKVYWDQTAGWMLYDETSQEKTKLSDSNCTDR